MVLDSASTRHDVDSQSTQLRVFSGPGCSLSMIDATTLGRESKRSAGHELSQQVQTL